jgi:UDP-N-acetylmuramoyl-tripeptide--D-alanyl-D-alanine ligase
MTTEPLWTLDAMTAAMGAQQRGALPQQISGISIDSRTVRPGEAYFAIKGDVHDGHDFVQAALNNGAALAVAGDDHAAKFARDARLLIVPDVLASLVRLGVAARDRFAGKVLAVTGSVGKTSTKEMLRCVLSAQASTHASVASFNNHWGVPLTLARTSRGNAFAVYEIGMNHAGEIEPLVKMVRPHVAIITTVEPVHLEFFASVQAIADAKAEIFAGVERGGAAVLNIDNAQYARLKSKAQAARIDRIVPFGAHADAEARLLDLSLHPDCSAIHAKILGHDITYKLGMPGRHMAMNSLAVLAASVLAGADLAQSALALSQMQPPSGRGARLSLGFPHGKATLIDESYNANPASMRAALNVLGQATVGRQGRRIAVLGDMLELGPTGPSLHAALADAIETNKVDMTFCCGPLMRNLWEALPSGRRGGYADTSAQLESQVTGAIRAGDAVMVKGSLGSKMKLIVTALEARFPQGDAGDDGVGAGPGSGLGAAQ